MMIRMSRGFGTLWKEQSLDDVLEDIVLEPRLRTLVHARLVGKGDGLVLEPLVARAPDSDSKAFQDRTGYEALINKIHVDDFIDVANWTERELLGVLIRQGTKAAVELSRRLEEHGKYRVLLSLDPDLPTMTLRFFKRRAAEPWGAEDPNAFQMEEVLIIDTGHDPGDTGDPTKPRAE